MASRFMPVSLGLNRRAGKFARPGFLLQARNLRYLPGDPDRAWLLLGRKKMNQIAIPAAASPATDDATVKTIYPFYIDGGAQYLIAHKGGSFFEAPLDLNGEFTEAKAVSSAVTPRGIPFGYRDSIYWPLGDNGFSQDLHFWVRQSNGWHKGGHRKPTATFTAVNNGSGTFASSTDVLYCIRIYDNTTGTESQHGDFVTKSAFNTLLNVLLVFANGVSVNGERGTHMRIYRSNLGEPAGIMNRVDGNGDGVALPIAPGYSFADAVDNITALTNGRVNADGDEGTQAWAEWGGPPPRARGGMIFNDAAILWGVYGQSSRVYYSALGLPECYPVDIDGAYQYYLTFSTGKQDTVMLCRRAGPYTLALLKNSIFRIMNLPTYAEAGFNRKVEDALTEDHGCCSFWGADSFGFGDEDSAQCVYASREHGLMLTNGVGMRPIVDQADWLDLVERSEQQNVMVRNYAPMQELWCFYTPKGGTRNTQALILDYSSLTASGIRVTGPVDVQATDAVLGWRPDGDPRMYLASSNSLYVFVQDVGSTDEQQNVDAAGSITSALEFPRVRLGGDPFHTGNAGRLSIEGQSGQQIDVAVTITAQDGAEEYTVEDAVVLGPGETADFAAAMLTGNGHRATIETDGTTGATYDETDPTCAPCFRGIRWEVEAVGRQKRATGA